jgi:hypothetical protein
MVFLPKPKSSRMRVKVFTRDGRRKNPLAAKRRVFGGGHPYKIPTFCHSRVEPIMQLRERDPLKVQFRADSGQL